MEPLQLLSPENVALSHTSEVMIDDIINLTSACLGHIQIALEASPEKRINRTQELESAKEAAELGMDLMRRLGVLIKPLKKGRHLEVVAVHAKTA